MTLVLKNTLGFEGFTSIKVLSIQLNETTDWLAS